MREIVETEFGDVVYEGGEPVAVLEPDTGDVMEEGGVDEEGGPIRSFIRRNPLKSALGAGLVGGGVVGGGIMANRAVHASRQRRRAALRAAGGARVVPAEALSAIQFPFISGESIRFASTPLSGSSKMMAAVNLLSLVDRAISNTPSAPVIKSAPSAAGVVSVNITSADLPALVTSIPPATYTSFFFPCFMIELGSSILGAQPSSPMNFTTLACPTEYAGLQNLIALGNMVVIPHTVQKRSAMLVVPWLIADSGPHPLMGVLTTTSANSLTITLSGVPDGTTMTVTLPGSSHDLIVNLRNYLRTGLYKHQHSSLQSSEILRLV